MKASDFDRKFDADEAIDSDLDLSGAHRPGLSERRVSRDQASSPEDRRVIDIDGLTREEKLELIERLCDNLTSTQQTIPLSEWQREELNRRIDEFERDGDDGLPAEEVLARLRGRDE
jgi:putative addiction module component (TIGR02574 family)